MEKRLLLFFAVTFILISLWPRLFPPPAPVEPPAAEAGSNVAPSGDGDRGGGDLEVTESTELPREPTGAEGDAADPRGGEGPSSVPEALGADVERTLSVETSLYRMVLTNRGARITSFTLHDYEDTHGGPYEMVSQAAAKQQNVRPLDVRLEDSGAVNSALTKALYVVEAPAEISVADGEERVVELAWSDGRGLEVIKRITIVGGEYTIGVEVSAKVRGQEVPKSVVYGPGVGDETAQSRYTGAEKGVVASGREVVLLSAGDVEDGEGDVGNVSATGVASHYFAAVLLPRGTEGASYRSRLRTATVQVEEVQDATATDEPPAVVDRDVITAALVGPARPMELALYVGPKKLERLQALQPGLEQIIEFGAWMRYPALVLRSWLLKIHDYVGNYGWAIVLLTVLINVLLIPLKHYSFVSMRKMQKIAPQTQKIRERYKKVKPTDPRYQEMNREMQELYKEHGVNPVSGCLPMLLMIPFFFAFYRMLMASIELRQAPFLFWIQDLSVHDPLFVLPILMGGTQLAIQKMTPQTSADPVQAKIMSFMPIMFTLILAWAPAGLVLYWFSNNLVSMAQQKITNRILADKDESEMASKSAHKAGKSGKDGGKNARGGKKRKGKRG